MSSNPYGINNDNKINTMKAIAINGSPRKKWNTATLLEESIGRCRSKWSQDRVNSSLRFEFPRMYKLLQLQIEGW